MGNMMETRRIAYTNRIRTVLRVFWNAVKSCRVYRSPIENGMRVECGAHGNLGEGLMRVSRTRSQCLSACVHSVRALCPVLNSKSGDIVVPKHSSCDGDSIKRQGNTENRLRGGISWHNIMVNHFQTSAVSTLPIYAV
jgi:hypothetical protein